MGRQGAEQSDDVARETYRTLRLMLVTLPVLLLVGSLLILLTTGEVETSISAYYFGPIRDIFVGAMVGIAVCLVVYRGSSAFEDHILNVAGFYAVFVALVPADLSKTIEELGAETPVSDALQEEPSVGSLDVAAATVQELSVEPLRISAGAALLVALMFVYVLRRARRFPAPEVAAEPRAHVAFWVVNALGVAFAGLVAWRVVEGAAFDWVHSGAAVLLIVSLAIAVASHLWPGFFGAEDHPSYRSTAIRGLTYRSAYAVILVLMVAGAGVVALVAGEYRVIAVEWLEVALFAVFWVLETARTWTRLPARRRRPSITRP